MNKLAGPMFAAMLLVSVGVDQSIAKDKESKAVVDSSFVKATVEVKTEANERKAKRVQAKAADSAFSKKLNQWYRQHGDAKAKAEVDREKRKEKARSEKETGKKK